MGKDMRFNVGDEVEFVKHETSMNAVGLKAGAKGTIIRAWDSGHICVSFREKFSGGWWYGDYDFCRTFYKYSELPDIEEGIKLDQSIENIRHIRDWKRI